MKSTGSRRDRAVLRAFSQRLKALRRAKKMSQQRLADAARLDRRYIVRLEAAERNPTLLILADLARALDVEIRDLTSSPNCGERK